jgi:CrcB protein
VITAVAFAVAAATGALARAEAGRRWNRHDGFPLGTLLVNVSGSFLLGLLWDVSPPMLTALGVGGLGAFTTFSSFARDAVALGQQGGVVRAAVYVAVTCAAGIGAASIGLAMA